MMYTNDPSTIWSEGFLPLGLLLLHAICCIGVVMFVLLGGAGILGLLDSNGFWGLAIGLLTMAAGGFWYFRKKRNASCIISRSDEKKDQ